MFKTKRQRRERALHKLAPSTWSDLPVPLRPNIPRVYYSDVSENVFARHDREDAEAIASITSDPLERERLVAEWLDKAEENVAFSKQLDRFLHLPTDAEERERHDYWATRRNIGYLILTVAAMLVTIMLTLWKAS